MQRAFTWSMLWLSLAGCSTQIDDYSVESIPRFNLMTFFAGKTVGHGMVQDRFGKQLRRFTVEMVGTKEGERLQLAETFYWNDGEEQTRIWHITALANNRYEATAGDVVGKAIGQEKGNALHWQYVLTLPIKGRTYDVRFEDWMFRQDETRAFNVATFKKFGVTLGTVTLMFEKTE